VSRGNVDDERRLVAVGEFNAVQAVGPDLMGQFFFIDVCKTEFPEETVLVGKNKHPCDLEFRGFGKTMPDQL
jgi:hypothetical protein